MSLQENYYNVQARILAACERAGRDPESVTLIAVSKTKPVGMIEELAGFGQCEFGENHVQEIVEKTAAFPDVRYHMIGHLQRNKVKQVVGRVVLIHSVDSLRLAEEISKESQKRGIVTDILVEVNVGNEESKYGFSFEETERAVSEIRKLSGVSVRGLMCVAPYVAVPEENRPLFHKMKQLLVDISSKYMDNSTVNILSMGMTNDFETAIEEGATHVRIGTALFGAREYNVGR